MHPRHMNSFRIFYDIHSITYNYIKLRKFYGHNIIIFIINVIISVAVYSLLLASVTHELQWVRKGYCAGTARSLGKVWPYDGRQLMKVTVRDEKTDPTIC